MIVNQKNPSSEQISDVLRNHFKIDLINCFVNFETLRREENPAAFDRMRRQFEKSLVGRPDREEILRRSFFGPSFAIHLQSVIPKSELKWIRSDMVVHYPVCTVDEIKRMQNPQTAQDDFLILRANAIAESARLKRVFLRRRSLCEKDWSLTSSFRDTAFKKYLATLPEEKREKCNRVPAGFAFLIEPNGACMRTHRGDIIVISEALEQYLYYMNAFLFEPEEFSADDSLASLMIAVRSMFLIETPDFDLDPRGPLPPILDQRLRAVVEDQLQFVIGHEYAHLLLNHLSRDAASAAPRGIIPSYIQRNLQYYTLAQNQELAADAAALLDPVIDDQVLADRLMGATWLFLGLDVLNGISRFIKNAPVISKTHPPPRDRLWILTEAVLAARPSASALAYSNEEIARIVERTLRLKSALVDHFFPENPDALEVHGSIYLPTFRGSKLVDHIDY